MSPLLGSGSIVMGTGIVSVALVFDQRRFVSLVLLVVAGLAWVAIAGLIGIAFWREHAGLRAQARAPVALTLVAATAVLGSRLWLDGLHTLAMALLAIAAVLWLALAPVLISAGALPRSGSSFMLTVSLQSLASLAAAGSASSHAGWLDDAALALWVIGLALYPVVLLRFDFAELRHGRGDQWVAGGALAISALALSTICEAAARQSALHPIRDTLRDVAAITWLVSMLWLPPLLASELRWPRLRYEPGRWSMLFPVGMYAASGFEVARVSHVHAAASFAKGWTWAGLALWLLVSWGLARRVRAQRRTIVPAASAER